MRLPLDESNHARLAARALAAEDLAEASIGLGDRSSDLAAVEAALRSRARGPRRSWPVAAGLATAAAVALIVVPQRGQAPPVPGPERAAPLTAAPAPALSVGLVEGTGASVEVPDGPRTLTVGDELVSGARVRVPANGGVTLVLDTGTRLDLEAGAAARVVELGAAQRFDLATGSLVAKVAKLGPGRRFVIATPDSEVEVKGTRFEVSVGSGPSPCAPSVRTRVTVYEGVVAVRYASKEILLEAGNRWPACSAPRAAAAPRARPSPVAPPSPVAQPSTAVVPPSTAVVPPSTLVAPPSTVVVPPSTVVVPPSTLAEQNDLFAAALEAGRRGDVDGAVRWLDRLITRYPTGQLTDAARAERRRLGEMPVAGAASD